MQNENNIPAIVPAIVADVPATPAPVAPVPTATAKPAKRASKPVNAKPVNKANVQTPSVAPVSSTYADERRAAAIAVGEFYNGASLPFKSASSKLSDYSTTNTKKPSVRTAALIAAMLAYAPDGTFDKRGHFTRGAFRVPAKLLDPKAKPGQTLAAMPESGCFGNMHGRVITHISGPIGGKQARDGIFRLNFAAARAELQQLGDKLAKPALAVLARLEKQAA